MLEAQSKAAPQKVDTSKIRRKVEKLKDLYLKDLIDRYLYEQDYTVLKAELAKAMSYQEQPKKPVDVKKITNLLATYPKLSRAGQKEFWGRILKRIVITQADDFFIEPI